MTHGEKFFNYLCNVGGRTNLLAIEEPQNKFKSPLEVFEYGLKHEKFVTDRINKLMDQARKDNDNAAQAMLNWFVTEQVEEEANFSLYVRKLQRIGNDGQGLLMLDQELAQRVFVPPAAGSA